MRKYFILMLIAFSVIPNYAQDSLAHYMDITARENPVILQKYYEYEAALQKIPQAGSLSDPEFNAGIFLTPMELVMGNQVAELQLMQMFPWFGTLRAAKDEMSLMANAAFESFRDTKLQVLFDMQKTWYELFKINEEIRIAEENLEILHSIERLTRVRFTTARAGGSATSSGTMSKPADATVNQGPMQSMQYSRPAASGNMTSTPEIQANEMESGASQGSLTDVFSVLIEMGDVENSIALLQSRLTSVRARFNTYLNRSSLNPVTIPSILPADTSYQAFKGINPDSFIVKNPMLAMQDYERQSIEARKRMVSRMGYPMFGLGLNYSIINRNEMVDVKKNGKDMIMPMVTITLPIYRKKYKSMRSEADHLSEAANYAFQSAYNSLSAEYYQAVQLYDDALRRTKLYHEQAELTRKSLNIMMQDFATSGSRFTDIMRLQQKLLDYENRHIAAVTDLNSAASWLARISGI